MFRNVISILLCGVMFICCSCSLITRTSDKKGGGGVVSAEPSWEVNALHINVKSDPQLNLFQGRPHTLVVCMYQLRDPNAFNQLADEEEGISKLLECTRFDGSVANAKRQVVQPGKETAENRDRAEGAKYLGVVAGYYNAKKDGVIRLHDISGRGLKKKTTSLEIDLLLGSKNIENLQVK